MPDQQGTSGNHLPGERPWTVTLLSILVMLAACFQLLKFSQVLVHWTTLETLPLSVPPFYLGTTSLLWAGAGGFFSWSTWAGKPWSRITGLIISLAYGFFFWIDRIWIAEAGSLQDLWPRDLVFTCAIMAAIWWSLNHPASRAYFRNKSC